MHYLPTLTDLNLVECNQGFCYYPLMVNLDRWNERCNTLDDPVDKICVPNKSEHVNSSNFNLTAKINEENIQKNFEKTAI